MQPCPTYGHAGETLNTESRNFLIHSRISDCPTDNKCCSVTFDQMDIYNNEVILFYALTRIHLLFFIFV